MRILVTGGAGFIGSAVVRHLIAAGSDEVVNLDLMTYAASGTALREVEGSPRYRFVQADIADARALEALFAEHQPTAVIHLAAESHVDRSITGPAPFVTTNVVGTFRLLEAALQHWRGLDEAARAAFRFVHVSTDEVYGSLGPNGAFTEATAYDPRSPYSASKAASDHLVSAWGHTYGLPVILSHCANNYGPYQYPEKLIPLMILNALEGAPLPVYGDGLNVRDWIHVDDQARALEAILRAGRPGATYNVGGREERTNLELVAAICDLVDQQAPDPRIGPRLGLIRHVADRPGHDRRYAIDPTRIERELGWRPQSRFDEGLARTVSWYLEHPQWWRPLRAKIARP